MKMFRILALSLLLPATALQAKVFLDYESDPLPLIKVNFVIPASRLTKGDTENLGLRFLSEFFDSGTQSLSRQKFQDALASYGANLDINVAYPYAEISSTFPLSGGKIPKGLTELIKDNWENPRINKENFERAKKFLKSNHLALLDRDSSLLNLSLQKVMMTALFGLFPYSTDTFGRIKLEEIEELHKNYFKRNGDIWAGIIGPAELKKDVTQMISTLFPAAGEIQEGILKEKLATGFQPEQKGLLKPTFLLIDKKDLAQIHYGFLRVSQKKSVPKTELTDKFTYYVLAGSGIESVYGKRIRGERGLSYQVSGMMDDYYDYPIVSLYSNPQRNKEAEAFEVLEKIVKETFNGGKILSSLKDDIWVGSLIAYRNSERQSGATPEGRLDRRKGIVMGNLSYQLYNTPIDDWSVKKSAGMNRLIELSNNSSMIVAALGDATELQPLIKKHFPEYDVLKVNFKEVINEGWLKKK